MTSHTPTIFTWCFVFGTHMASAQSGALPRYNADEDGLWVEGYDPVSYTIDHKAAQGSKSFTHTYGGATFRFVDQAHRDRFVKEPERYLPAFGGWCAYAMGAKNEKVEVDPETFKVKDGKVYLFYNRFFTNTLDDWNKDEQHLLPAAHRNWAAFKHAR
jgi:YHS domain-containing protein